MDEEKLKEPVMYHLRITESDFEALKIIRSHFGENDKTPLEHLAYSVLDRIIKS